MEKRKKLYKCVVCGKGIEYITFDGASDHGVAEESEVFWDLSRPFCRECFDRFVE